MAIPPLMFDLLQQVAQRQNGGRACSAGYPDLLLPKQQVAAALGDKAAQLRVRADSAQIAAWHGVERVMTEIYDAHDVFAALGYQLDVIDLHAARGGEIIVDLNQPLPAALEGTFDLVVDSGTCEHCFNIGQAAINLASLLRKDGYLIQAMPLNSYNHGFYNVNPTWFHDFYGSNGFVICHLQAVSDIVWNPKVYDVPAHDRFHEAPPKSILLAIVQRQVMQPITFPTQFKYRANPGLAG